MSHVLAGADEIIEYSPYRMGLLQMLRSGIGTELKCSCRAAELSGFDRTADQGLETGCERQGITLAV